MKIIPVVLAGGIGERFWPLSRSSLPKQLLPLISEKPMIVETLERVSDFCTLRQKPIIITGKTIAPQIKKVLPRGIPCDIIQECVGKNTAPAIALAAQWIIRKYGDTVMLVLSADHAIAPKKSFNSAARFAAQLAEKTDQLIVFGIKPSRPDTGYGYIQLGKQIASRGKNKSFKVKRFVEKPQLNKAKSYLKSGNYLWNSGMFVWKCSVILEEFQSYMPNIYSLIQNADKKSFTQKAVDSFYKKVEKESIDFGIMEYSKRVAAVAPGFSWDDVGSWESVSRHAGKNKTGSTLVGHNIFETGLSDSIVVNRSSLALSVIGLKNVIIVSTDDAVLAISRDKLGELKKHLSIMKKDNRFSKKLF